MKKKVAATTIVGLILEMLAGIAFVLMGKVVSMLKGTQIVGPKQVLSNIKNFLAVELKQADVMTFVIIGICGVLAILVIIQFIMAIRKKHGKAIWVTIACVLFVGMTFAFLTISFVPGAKAGGRVVYGEIVNKNGVSYGTPVSPLGVYKVYIEALKNKEWVSLLYWVAPVLFVIGFILSFIGLIADMRLLASLPKPAKKAKKSDKAYIVRDDDIEDTEGRQEAQQALAVAGYDDANRAVAQSVPAAPGMNGPFLIQYINTYAPNEPARKPEPVAEKPAAPALTADDIRDIIKAEFKERDDKEKKEEPVAANNAPLAQPFIVNIPSDPEPEVKPLTREEVQQMLSDEFTRFLQAEKEARDEADRRRAEEEATRKAHEEELAKAREEALAEARRQAEEDAARKAAEEEAARKAEEESWKPANVYVEEEPVPALTADDIREIVASELEKAKPEPEPEPEPEEEEVVEEEPVDIRAIIRDELEAHRRQMEEEAARKAAEEEAAQAREEEIAKAREEALAEARRQAEEEAARKAAEEEAARKAEEEEAAR